jgi:putative two-component system response regulator
MVTGVDDTALAKEALDLGAYGYVIKPFEANEIVINVFNALRRRQLEIENRRHRDHLSQLVSERTAALESSLGRLAEADRALRRSHEATVRRLALAAEFHDPTTGAHLLRMSSYSAALAREIGIEAEQVELIRMASPMHDIGKIGIPDDILRKPGRLTADDLVVMRQHPQIGYDLLARSESDLLDLGAVIALTHHERYDGTGYPRKMRGSQIPIFGRIVAVADTLAALLQPRPHRPASSLAKAIEIIEAQSGSSFDPSIVQAVRSGISEISRVVHEYFGRAAS